MYCYIAGDDYTESTGDFTFTSANQAIPQCLNVPIIDDSVVEGSETFLGLLSNTDNIPRLTLDPQQTTITIADDESKATTFANLRILLL